MKKIFYFFILNSLLVLSIIEGFLILNSFPALTFASSIGISLSTHDDQNNKIIANKPYLIDTDLKLENPDAISYYLIFSQDPPLRSPETSLPFPEFNGDSQKCESTIRPCSWVSNSTLGLGYRLLKPANDLFKDQYAYQSIPAPAKGEPVDLLFINSETAENSPEIQTSLKLLLSKNYLVYPWEGAIKYTLVPMF